VHLLFVLLAGPRSESVVTVMQLATAALDARHRVSVFLAGDGTAYAEDLSTLREIGARVMWCSADAAVRGLDRPGSSGRGSFVDLAGMASDADRVLVF